jgi:hypothetical protein
MYLAGPSASARAEQSFCNKPQCIVVHVNEVSSGSASVVYGPPPSAPVEPITTNVRVSTGSRTYQLTCNRDSYACVAPRVGSEYELITVPGTKPESLKDHEGEFPHYGKAAFLKGTNGTLGPYWIVAEVSGVGTIAFQHLIAECNEREEGLNENDCTKWLARRAWLRAVGCHDAETSVACHSFQQLNEAADPDLLDLLARMEHVYVCFSSREDVFFALWFPEPSEWHWGKANADDQKVFGIPLGALIQFGFPGVYYYDKGVSNTVEAISDIGVWSYLPQSTDTSPARLALVATSNDAKFVGSVFRIDGTSVALAESYKNNANHLIKHTMSLQRSTGRFVETYAEEPSGHTILNYSGQCMVVPNVY